MGCRPESLCRSGCSRSTSGRPVNTPRGCGASPCPAPIDQFQRPRRTRRSRRRRAARQRSRRADRSHHRRWVWRGRRRTLRCSDLPGQSSKTSLSWPRLRGRLSLRRCAGQASRRRHSTRGRCEGWPDRRRRASHRLEPRTDACHPYPARQRTSRRCARGSNRCGSRSCGCRCPPDRSSSSSAGRRSRTTWRWSGSARSRSARSTPSSAFQPSSARGRRCRGLSSWRRWR